MVALDRYPGSFPALFDQIARQSYTAMRFVIRATATNRLEAEQLLRHSSAKPLAQFLSEVQAACLALLASSLGVGQGEANHSSSSPKPFAEHAADLYRIASGWLGWTPSETWNAGLDEIVAAYDGHVARLVAMTPGATETNNDEAQRRANEAEGLDPDFNRSGLHALMGRHQ